MKKTPFKKPVNDWPELKMKEVDQGFNWYGLKFKNRIIFKGTASQIKAFIKGVLYAVTPDGYLTWKERDRFEELAKKEGWVE